MGHFINRLRTEQLERRLNRLITDLGFLDDRLGLIITPAGFVTNYASIDFLRNPLTCSLYTFLVTYGNLSCSMHDFLYSQAKYSRFECDNLLYRALRAEEVGAIRASIFWIGVRVGGWRTYGKPARTYED